MVLDRRGERAGLRAVELAFLGALGGGERFARWRSYAVDEVTLELRVVFVGGAGDVAVHVGSTCAAQLPASEPARLSSCIAATFSGTSARR